jgi:COP9 signalosome complex subunit 12
MATAVDSLWQDFTAANTTANGYLLASTISPEPPKHDVARLYNLRRWTNEYSLTADLRQQLQHNSDLRFERKEAAAWSDIFAAHWHFVGRLLAAEEAQNAGRHGEADWAAVYEGWKDVLNAVCRAYNNNFLEAWTIPCLYTVGKYLRVFAIKAGEQASSQRASGAAFGGLQEEDASGSKNEKLEDAARQINRIFALCLGDRYVLPPSHCIIIG